MSKEEYLKVITEISPYLNVDRVSEGYDYGLEAHSGQLRKDMTAYFNHPVAVSIMLAELEMDEDTIISGLLHDTIEDTFVTKEDIQKKFGFDVAKLVDGVTKLASVSFETKQELQVENLRKMFIAMSSDIRVIIIKLADRLHNMRTLDAMVPLKQREIAEETLNIYAPIAHRLGIFRIKWELEDISLKYIDPDGYRDLVHRVRKKRKEREDIIAQYIDHLNVAMDDAGIKCEIKGRPKNFYSIYRKMKVYLKDFDEIYDLTAIRIIVEDEKNLYAALGIVHSLWNFIPGRFKDYVSTPKKNLYRSLHTTLMGNQEPFEIQIRTKEMHEQAEYGFAAHWKYKEGREKEDIIDQRISWFRQMMELQSDVQEPGEFMDSLKFDILNTEVYLFTPEGDVIELPEGSTPIDFAYKIHSEVGNNAVGAKVNGRIVPLNYQLSNGQIVEILTIKNGQPSRDWLKFVKSTQAKQRIRQWFKKERWEENIEKGEEMLNIELRRHKIQSKDVLNEVFLEQIMRRLSVKSLDDLYGTVGYGGILTGQIVPKIREKLSNLKPQDSKIPKLVDKKAHNKQIRDNTTGIVVKGMGGIQVRFAKCCTPVPGDPIIGYITRGRGVTVHRADCRNFEQSEDTQNRFIEVDWISSEDGLYYVSVQVVAVNRRGIMSDITGVVAGFDMEISGVNAKVSAGDLVVLNLSLEIKSVEDLNQLFKKIKSNPDIVEISRTVS